MAAAAAASIIAYSESLEAASASKLPKKMTASMSKADVVSLGSRTGLVCCWAEPCTVHSSGLNPPFSFHRPGPNNWLPNVSQACDICF
jgi:hypothetical protein